MDDKIDLDLLTRMYSEIMQRFDDFDTRLDGINKKLDKKADKADLIQIKPEVTEPYEIVKKYTNYQIVRKRIK
jgi:hypothetical protein